MKIIIPSAGRAESMTTHSIFPDAEVCIPEKDVAAYRKAGIRNITSHPNSLKGITPKRNWILRRFPDDIIVMFDDDLTSVSKQFCRIGDQNSEKDPSKVMTIVDRTVSLAAEAGAKLFGWCPTAATVKTYSGFLPFCFNGYINGCAMGFMPGHGLSFDEEITSKGDYDICLLNAMVNRYMFRDMRYAFSQTSTFAATGGCALVRSKQTEIDDVKILKRKWGDAVWAGQRITGTRMRQYADGHQQVMLKIPF